MDASTKRDIRLVITAGALGALYVRLTAGALTILFITRCLRIPGVEWQRAAALIPLVGVLHLLSAFLTERLRRRKLLSLTCFAVARFATPAIALLPFVTGETDTRVRIVYLVIAMVTQAACNTLAISGWMSWIADIVPQKERGRYYAVRLAVNTLIPAVVPFLAGLLIDHFGKADPRGYVIVFGVAFVFGELDIVIHSWVAARPMPEHLEHPRLIPLLIKPWRHAGFRSFMLYRCMFLFGNALVGVFGIVYLDKVLDLSSAQITALNSVLVLAQAPCFFLWRKIGDRVGYRTVLQIASTLSGIGILYWWFLPLDNPAVLVAVLVLARVYYGFVSAGSMLGTSTLNMNVAPDAHRSTYFAQVSTLVAIASAAGLFCGSHLYKLLEPVCGGSFLGTQLTPVHVLVALLGLFRILSIRLFYRHIPDAKAEAAMPRITRVLRTNAFRVFPTILPLERPLSQEQRARHIESMRQHVPSPREAELEKPLKTVLKDELAEEEEFHHIIEQVRGDRARSILRMTNPISELAALHRSPAQAKAETGHIRQLYASGDLAGCLRTVQLLAHKTADPWESEKADDAVTLIDALVENVPADQEPREEAVLLAIYAYLQIVREPEEGEDNAV